MRTVQDEVERCLPFFLRLCVHGVVSTGARLDESAVTIARELHGRLVAAAAPAALRQHFEDSLSDLVDLVSSLAPRLPPQMIADFASKSSPARVAATLERTLRGRLTSRTAV